MAEFWDSVSSILVVAIPTLIGGLFTTFVANKWQTKQAEFNHRKELFAFRRNLLTSFELGITKPVALLYEFAYNVANHYGTPVKGDDTTTSLDINFPTDQKLQPLAVFQADFVKLQKTVNTTLLPSWSVFSDISLYFKDGTFGDELTVLASRRYKFLELIENLLNTRSEDDFVKTYSEIDRLWIETKALNKEVIKKIIKSDLRDMTRTPGQKPT